MRIPLCDDGRDESTGWLRESGHIPGGERNA
jgi:hypothetical protein